jgi:hypothetical protein
MNGVAAYLEHATRIHVLLLTSTPQQQSDATCDRPAISIDFQQIFSIARNQQPDCNLIISKRWSFVVLLLMKEAGARRTLVRQKSG